MLKKVISKKMKVSVWAIYILSLIGTAYLISEGFYMYHFWRWVLS